MKSTKKNLNIILSVALCVSFSTFAMEKEKSRASHSWSAKGPIGQSDTSSESGIDQKDYQMLETYIKRLQKLDSMIMAELKDQDITQKERSELLEMLDYVNKTIIMANDMILGLTPVNTRVITAKMNTAIKHWNQR